MHRRQHLVLPVVVGISLLLSCTDQPSPVGLEGHAPISPMISDGARGGDPNFFWLPPTVATNPTLTGPFDSGALNELVVEVCELDGAGHCTGDPVEHMTATSQPTPSRLQMDVAQEFYSVNWMTGRSHIDRDAFYRVRVLRNGAELGFLDVDPVQNTPELATVDTSRYVGIVRGQQLPIRFRIQRPTARTNVKVNEVESSGGVPGDWIELYNTANVPVSLAGYIVKDNDDTHRYNLPATASIPAHGFYVVEEADLGFGLGAADAARLFTPDSATLVDSYSWTAHAPTTYGRCPDGSGAFQTTTVVTKGAANDCSVVIRINEIESSGGTPGDWVELYNPGPRVESLAGYVFKDNDDTHSYTIPAGTTIAAGGYYMLEEAAFGFGLGAADAARLFRPDGTVMDSYSWTAHAATTYGRCPNGAGEFKTTTSVTKNAANDCSTPLPPVRINEVESSDGIPGDWVELYNGGTTVLDLAGYIFKDNDNTHAYSIPAGTSIAVGGYFVLEEAAFGFGLGSADAARLYAPGGTTLVDSTSWTAHAATTYGRCPNGSGDFTTTTNSTKGAANACPGQVTTSPWPGDTAIRTVDDSAVFHGNLSGLMYQGSGSATPGVMWAARNGPGTLFRLVWNGTIWTPDPTNDWSAGKLVHYPDGTGNVDAEGVTFGATPAAGIYISSERNNDANGISRNSVLRFDPAAPGTSLTATNEWNLTADLPVVGPNLGMEAIAWIPDAFLVARAFFDSSKGHTYNPAEYPDHAGGIFFVGLEANGVIYAYALNHVNNSFTRLATIPSGFIGVMDLSFDRELNQFWAVCDDGCQGRTEVLAINGAGRFAVTRVFERPSGMPNLNNEGFTVASQSECTGAGLKPAYWSDDSETGGHAIRRGFVTCTPF